MLLWNQPVKCQNMLLILIYDNENGFECDMWVNNLYPSVKLEYISDSDKVMS